MFRVGQKVVCINAGLLPGWRCFDGWLDNDAPTEGAIYTVTSVHADHDGDMVLHLAEIRRGPIARREWGEAVGYGIARFRPVVERKTSIEIFQKMLIPQGADA